MDHKQIDELLWFPETITKLTQKGIKDPIFKILDIFKTQESLSLQLQRHLERAMGGMIAEFTAEEQEKLKVRMNRWMDERISIKVYKANLLPITFDDSSDQYEYRMTSSYLFFNSEEAAMKLFEIISDFKLENQMYSLDQCRHFVSSKARREMHFQATCAHAWASKDFVPETFIKYKVSITHEHQFS